MPRVRPHYAVKANPDRRVVKALMQEGCSFEIASTAELDLLLSLGVNAAEVFYSNPVKSRQAIAYAAAKGVEWFVVDSVDELRRVHEIKADAKIYLRIATPNIGSDWPLSGKFGAGAAETREIILTAAEARRRPRRRDLPRRLAVPQPGELARRHRKGAHAVRCHDQGGPQAAHARHRRRLPGAPRQADSRRSKSSARW